MGKKDYGEFFQNMTENFGELKIEMNMDVREKLKIGYYKNKLEYPKMSQYKHKCDCGCPNCNTELFNKEGFVAVKNSWNEEQRRLRSLFKKDALEEVGLSDNPKKDKIFDKAWDDAHSSGKIEVLEMLEELSDLF